MKIVRTNKTYKLYDDDMETLDSLPVLTYDVKCSREVGFFLQERSSFELMEKKVYGVHTEKVDKILNSFKYFNRNLGVLLSGDKGIGKSLFVKMLALKAMEQGIPVITIDEGYVGLSAFLDSIRQEVLVIFDEFDKNFSRSEHQNTLLGLFDGMSSGKKLFAITCNSTENLSDFLIGRPGRFHYHIRFQYPHPSSVKEYLEDNVKAEFRKEIDAVVCHSMTSPLSFDSLRAIAFELNMGDSFKEAMKDLNIVSRVGRGNFAIIISNGEKPIYAASKITIDFAGEHFNGIVYRVKACQDNKLFMSDTQSRIFVYSLKGFKMDYETGVITIPAENATLNAIEDDEVGVEAEQITKIEIKCNGFGSKEPMAMKYQSENEVEGLLKSLEAADEEEEEVGTLDYLQEVGELDGID